MALEMRCQAAQYLAAADDDGGSPYATFYSPQHNLPAFAPSRYHPQYAVQQLSAAGLPAAFVQADSAALAAAAAVAAAAVASEWQQQQLQQQQDPQLPMETQQQQQQPIMPPMLVGWPGLECAVSPKQTNAPGDGSGTAGGAAGSGGGHSEGTTTTTVAPVVHSSSPGISPSAAAAAAAGAVGTPTSRRPGVRRVSANKALDALRCMNASAHSTESDWDEESEDGARSPTGTAWHHNHHQRRQAAAVAAAAAAVAAGVSRLQGSRLRASDSAAAVQRGSRVAPGQRAASAAGTAAQMAAAVEGVLNSHMVAGQSGAGLTAGDMSYNTYLDPATLQQQQQWSNNEYDLQGWEASLAAHLRGQQQQQQQWGSAYDGSYGGAGSGGGAASFDEEAAAAAQHCNQPQHPAHMSAGGGGGGPAAGHVISLSLQRSAPAGMCFSRSNSPVISTGLGPAANAAGMPALLVQGSQDMAAGHNNNSGHMAVSLPHAWSLPVPARQGQGQHELYSTGMECTQQDVGSAGQSPHPGMQAHDIEQVLERLIPSTEDGTGLAAAAADGHVAAAGGAAADVTMSHSPPEHQDGRFGTMHGHFGNSMPESAPGQQQQQPPGSFMAGGGAQTAGIRTLSPQSSMTAAAAAAAAALVGGGMAAPAARQQGRALHLSLPGAPPRGSMPRVLPRALSLGMLPDRQQQQHVAAHGMLCDEDGAAGMAPPSTLAHAATGSPDSQHVAAGALMGQHSMDLAMQGMGPVTSLQSLRSGMADSQGGSSGLREELAGVSLDNWAPVQQQQQHTEHEAADLLMADAAAPDLCDMHQQVHTLLGMAEHNKASHGKQPSSPGAAAAAASGGINLQQQGSDQLSPHADFDSVDTAAAAATFEAQLAACCGNKDSQEAVFRAWLDALLPQGAQGGQNKQQEQVPQQSHRSNQLQQFAADLQAALGLQPGPVVDASNASPPSAPASCNPPPVQLSHQEQEQSPEVHTHADHEFGDNDDIDLEAAAAALHLAAQRACLEAEDNEGPDAEDACLNPEEDFRELLDLLLDS